MVRGEVTSPGTYPIKRGDRISDLIERAGGMSSYAYSRGIVLLRKSVEELQRERLKVLISELESSLLKEEASSAFGAETGEIALRKQVLESRKQLIRVMEEKMELVVGRVVVELDRDLEKFRGTERDLELESGDELYIPSVPSFVLMMGDVFNQVGLTYKPEKRLKYYLSEVGGLTKNADKKGIYIIRADGTVVSNETNEFADMVHWDSSRNRFSVGGIYVEGIYPGDTVIVPTETKFPIPWRPLIKDITQIIFQSLSTVAIINNL
jgi:polysaccharide export outer membrane protein